MITTVTDIGAQAATKPVVALAYLALVRRLAGCSETPPGFGHRTRHVGVLASSAGFLTFPLLHDAVLSIALALFSQTLAFVCAPLALVCRLLTIVGDPLPLIGEAVSFVGDPPAPVELNLTQREQVPTLVRLARSDAGIIANHTLIKRLGRVGGAIARAQELIWGKLPCFRGPDARRATAALLSGGWGWTGVRDGTAHADDNGWGPPHHWCPAETPVPATGNHITDTLHWDWNVCHTYYFLWQGMGNVSNMIWDGDNPPPKPGPPIGLYCDPAPLTNCRIGDHP